jgi:hypothetical protein
MTARVCLVCGASLAGRRSDAKCCGSSCRSEWSRIAKLLRGDLTGRYRSVAISTHRSPDSAVSAPNRLKQTVRRDSATEALSGYPPNRKRGL